ncbi:MAG: carboxypeptidase regulatory-like domain-containing protein [Candidatus Dadabacteria bacterium]|nr:MAG: carboxypeptidase regulatory-like domain-containing protein [Candidatus Dadabacteria bacterium]
MVVLRHKDWGTKASLILLSVVFLISFILSGCGGARQGTSTQRIAVTGTLRDSDGVPVAGARVAGFDGRSTTTAEDGSFSLEALVVNNSGEAPIVPLAVTLPDGTTSNINVPVGSDTTGANVGLTVNSNGRVEVTTVNLQNSSEGNSSSGENSEEPIDPMMGSNSGDFSNSAGPTYFKESKNGGKNKKLKGKARRIHNKYLSEGCGAFIVKDREKIKRVLQQLLSSKYRQNSKFTNLAKKLKEILIACFPGKNSNRALLKSVAAKVTSFFAGKMPKGKVAKLAKKLNKETVRKNAAEISYFVEKLVKLILNAIPNNILSEFSELAPNKQYRVVKLFLKSITGKNLPDRLVKEVLAALINALNAGDNADNTQGSEEVSQNVAVPLNPNLTNVGTNNAQTDLTDDPSKVSGGSDAGSINALPVGNSTEILDISKEEEGSDANIEDKDLASKKEDDSKLTATPEDVDPIANGSSKGPSSELTNKTVANNKDQMGVGSKNNTKVGPTSFSTTTKKQGKKPTT